MISVRTPESKTEFDRYYDLRWRVLREPWQQPRGSERDSHEEKAIHAMALNDEGQIIGVARLHQVSNTTARIRYMAVEGNWRRRGIGEALLHYLEKQARLLGVRHIKLNARENSVDFYTRRGYQITGPGHLLYGEIRHQVLEKQLDD